MLLSMKANGYIVVSIRFEAIQVRINLSTEYQSVVGK
jgi:hypothetical protein